MSSTGRGSHAALGARASTRGRGLVPVLCGGLLAGVGAGCSIPEPLRPIAPPDIVRFEVVPFVVEPGAQTRVRWQVEGQLDALELQIGAASTRPLLAPSGAVEVRVEADADLILIARGPGGERRAGAAVRVGRRAPVAIEQFTATPTRARASEPIRVQWSTRAADRVALLRGELVMDDDLPSAGATIVRLEQSAELTLRVEGLGGPVVQTLRVAIGAPPASIIAFEASPPQVAVNRPATLRWEVANVDALTIFREGVDGVLEVIRSDPFPARTGSETRAEPAGRHRFLLEVSGGGVVRRAWASLLVTAPTRPDIERFTVTPTVTGAGGEARLTWAVRNAETVSLQIEPGAPELVDSVGIRILRAAESPIRASLLAIGSGGTEGRQVSLALDPDRPQIIAFGASPSRSAPGEPVALFWDTGGADRVWIRDELGRVQLDELAAQGFGELRPPGPIGLELVAEDSDGRTTRGLRLVVGVRPELVRFEALDPSYRPGRPIRFAFDTRHARSRRLFTPTRPPVSLTVESGTVALRRSDQRLADPDGLLEVSSDLFVLSATASSERLPPAGGNREVEPNDTSATAHTLLPPPSAFAGSLRPGDRDALAIVGPAPRRLRILPQCSSTQLALRVQPLDAEGAPVERTLVIDPLPCDGVIERSLAALPDDRLLTVESSGGGGPAVETPYRLVLEAVTAICGDGIEDRDEACDDGNLVRGDGCDDRCRIEGLDELEPNDAPPSATRISPGTTLAFLGPTDHDWFALAVPFSAPAGRWTFVVDQPDGGCDLDVRLGLVDAAGQTVTETTGDGLGCPLLTGPATVLTPGTWYLRVTPGSGRRRPTRGRYRLLAAAPPAP